MTQLNSVPLVTPAEQRIKDTEHLKLLAIFHYVFGGVTAATSSFALLHFFMGLMMVLNPSIGAEAGPVGWIFMIIGAVVVLAGWSIGAAMIYSGRMLQQRRRSLYSQIIAALCCLSIPFGTALGVCTFLVLRRPSVKALYDQTARGETALPPPVPTSIIEESEEQLWNEIEKQSVKPEPDKRS